MGHRPLQGRCPSHDLIPTYTNLGASGTADHVTLLRLLIHISVITRIQIITFVGFRQPTDEGIVFFSLSLFNLFISFSRFRFFFSG